MSGVVWILILEKSGKIFPIPNMQHGSVSNITILQNEKVIAKILVIVHIFFPLLYLLLSRNLKLKSVSMTVVVSSLILGHQINNRAWLRLLSLSLLM